MQQEPDGALVLTVVADELHSLGHSKRKHKATDVDLTGVCQCRLSYVTASVFQPTGSLAALWPRWREAPSSHRSNKVISLRTACHQAEGSGNMVVTVYDFTANSWFEARPAR